MTFAQIRKAAVAALGAVLLALSEAYADNPYVQAAIALATVLGVYGVRNEPAPSS
jgi:hypothetical protein